jgi:hypothetical protein
MYVDSFSKKGNEYAVADIAFCDEDKRCVFRTRNTVIYYLAPRQ